MSAHDSEWLILIVVPENIVVSEVIILSNSTKVLNTSWTDRTPLKILNSSILPLNAVSPNNWHGLLEIFIVPLGSKTTWPFVKSLSENLPSTNNL